MTAAVVPARKLGSGGEAEVYEVEGRSRVAYKRYRHPTTERTAKLRVMVAHPPEGLDDCGHVSIAWPAELVEEGGQVIGFTMARIDTASTVPLFQVYNPQSRRQVAPGFSWRYLLRTARNVVAIVDAVHRAGYVIGDLNESNFLVSKRALVTLVDCDSLQVTDPDTDTVHHCPVGKPEFLAPELQRADLAVTPRTEASDRFALAVLLHLILLEGAHPFAGVWRGRGDPPDIGTRIARRAAAHHRRGPVEPSPFALDLGVLPHRIRRLFQRALGPGLRRPAARPSAGEWLAALEAAELTLTTCPRSTHHQFAGHLRSCPWCRRLRRGLPDPFPGPAGGAGVEPPPPTKRERAVAGTVRVGRRASRTTADAAGRLVRASGRRIGAIVGPPVGRPIPRATAAAAAAFSAPLLAVAVMAAVFPWRVGWRSVARSASAHGVMAGGAAALWAMFALGWAGGSSLRLATAVSAAAIGAFGPWPVDRGAPALPAEGRAAQMHRRLLRSWGWRGRWTLAAASVVVAVMAHDRALAFPLDALFRVVQGFLA